MSSDNAEGNIAMNDGNVMKYLRNDNDISWACQFCGHPFRWEVQPQTFRHHLTMICKSVEDDVREAAAWFFEAECSRYGGSRTAGTSVASNSVAQAGKEAEAETEGSRYDQGAEVQPERFRHHLTRMCESAPEDVEESAQRREVEAEECSNVKGEKRVLDSELWHACAGPLVSLPAVGSRVVYFPQGHCEQVAASTNKEVDAHIPNYPRLPPLLICQLHNVTMHADVETDEVYAQMTLQPLSPQEQKDAYLPAELGTPSKQPTNYFCKTLTASDTITHGGFSVPHRAAEEMFPPLDFSQQPPAQELIARDLHDNEWKFRHIFRGQPERHLLTTGWSVFVRAKRLVAGDSVIFISNEKNQLLLGIRRANRPQTVMQSPVLSSDSMHLGLVAAMHLGLLTAAAHAAATNSRFTIFYNPRATPSEFVIPLSKYVKAVYYTRVSVGMRFRMLFETEESGCRRYMGTITGISDLDSVRWQNSHWRSVKVGWDESTAGERQPRVSLWEIESLTTFPMYPSPFPQQSFLQNVQEHQNQSQAESQSQLMQQQLQHQHSLNSQHQQQQQQQVFRWL